MPDATRHLTLSNGLQLTLRHARASNALPRLSGCMLEAMTLQPNGLGWRTFSNICSFSAPSAFPWQMA